MDDLEFENFWFTLKRNMCNFYKNESKINEWSDKLNTLKEHKEYHMIQLCILEYLEEMAGDLIVNYNTRIADIFYVNLKRWSKIILKTNFLNKYKFYEYMVNFNKLKSKIYLIMKLNEHGYKEITEYYDYNSGVFDLDKLMLVIINHEQSGMLEHLFYVFDMNMYILEKYGIDVSNMKLTKLVHILKYKI